MGRQARSRRASTRPKTLPESDITPSRASANEDRNARIWKLELSGYSSREIGALVGLSHTQVLAILRELRQTESPACPKEEVRATSHARLLRLLRALEKGVEAGDPTAVKEYRMIDESIRKMYGADGPLEVNVTQTTQQDLAIQDMISAAKAHAAAEKAKITGG